MLLGICFGLSSLCECSQTQKMTKDTFDIYDYKLFYLWLHHYIKFLSEQEIKAC